MGGGDGTGRPVRLWDSKASIAAKSASFLLVSWISDCRDVRGTLVPLAPTIHSKQRNKQKDCFSQLPERERNGLERWTHLGTHETPQGDKVSLSTPVRQMETEIPSSSG